VTINFFAGESENCFDKLLFIAATPNSIFVKYVCQGDKVHDFKLLHVMGRENRIFLAGNV
jgi:hypothetical protein